MSNKGARWVLTVLATLCLGLIPACNRAEPPSMPVSEVDSAEWEPESHGQSERERQRPASPFNPGKSSKSARLADGDAVFTNLSVLRIDLEIPRSGMSALRRTAWGNGRERPEARATVREGNVVYRDVAVHLKGSAGSFRPLDDKPGLTLKFDKFLPDQTFHGLNKISLNNSVQDSSFLCEKISRELMAAAGVPVPRAAHALVTINGRELGLYVLLEGANKKFLKRFFSNAKGNLFDGGFCHELHPSLSVNSGDNPSDRSGLRKLVSVMRQGNPSFERLDEVLDIDRFLSMLALEVLLWHWDGYTMNRNNWRVFHDLDSNKMVFIPHGMDQLFGKGRPIKTYDPAKPHDLKGQLSQALLSTRQGQARYRERVGQLYTNVFLEGDTLARVGAMAAGVSAALADSHPQMASGIQSQAAWLKKQISKRGEALARYFGPPSPPLEFASNDVARLSRWSTNVLTGSPVFAEIKEPSGKVLLNIQAGADGTTSSSFRTRVVLTNGNYRLEGRMRLKNVAIDQGDGRGGAGLRISKGNMPQKLTGTTDWTEYRYPFTVEDTFADVELICELKATKGEVWFDASSLRLARLP